MALAYPFALVFDVTIGAVAVGALALAASGDAGEASPHPSEMGSRWCWECYERREDRRDLGRGWGGAGD